MRILLDECVDLLCASFFSGANRVVHVKDVGLLGTKNGELVRVASEGFDVLVTVDRQMQFQTSLKGVNIAVAVFRSTKGILDYARLILVLEANLTDLRFGEYKVFE